MLMKHFFYVTMFSLKTYTHISEKIGWINNLSPVTTIEHLSFCKELESKGVRNKFLVWLEIQLVTNDLRYV